MTDNIEHLSQSTIKDAGMHAARNDFCKLTRQSEVVTIAERRANQSGLYGEGRQLFAFAYLGEIARLQKATEGKEVYAVRSDGEIISNHDAVMAARCRYPCIARQKLPFAREAYKAATDAGLQYGNGIGMYVTTYLEEVERITASANGLPVIWVGDDGEILTSETI